MSTVLKFKYIANNASVSKTAEFIGEPEIKEILAERSSNPRYVEELITGTMIPLKRFVPIDYSKGYVLNRTTYEYINTTKGFSLMLVENSEVSDEDINEYYLSHPHLDSWQESLDSNFSPNDVEGKKKYKCLLQQVKKEDGYVSPRDYDAKKELKPMYELIVEKTLNPYVVREISTGMPISVLHLTGVVPEFGNQLRFSANQPMCFKKLHTFVVSLTFATEGKALANDHKGFDLATNQEVTAYMRSHGAEFEKDLRSVLLAGENNMYEKLIEEKDTKIATKEEAKLTRYLAKKAKKKN